MRLDYYCAVKLRDAKREEITHVKTLKRFDGFVEKSEGSDFTEFLEDTLSDAHLLGEHIQLEFRPAEGRLYARASFHEKSPLDEAELEELSDHVRGQFIDGYASSDIALRRFLKQYWIEFVHEEISGPIKVDAPRPAQRKTKSAAKTDDLTRLRDAVKAGDAQAVSALLDAGVKIDGVPKPIDQYFTEMPALSVAASNDNLEIAKLLLSHGADPNNANGVGPGLQGKTAIMRTSSLDMIDLLLAAGADPNHKGEAGETLITWRRREADMMEDILPDHAKELRDLADKIERHLG